MREGMLMPKELRQEIPLQPEDNIEITVEEPVELDIQQTPEEPSKTPFKKGIIHSLSRNLAGGLAALSIATTAMAPNTAEAGKTAKVVEVPKKKTPETYRPKTHTMGDLQGRAFANLYNDYTGIEGKAKEKETIDFRKQLHLMWEKKIEKSGNKSIIKEVAKTLEQEYNQNDNNPMTFEQYEKQIKKSIDELKLNWDKVAKIRKLTPEEKKVVENIGKSIGSKELIAYSLTELMPSNDGKFNVGVMDFLLRNGGEKYVNSIPAFYDEKASFGPYQFTEFAVYDTPTEKRGASVLNKAVDGKKIPGSVSKLRGNDHHKAAYLFAMNNIVSLVKRLDKEELETFNKKWAGKKDELVQYIATAHHAPNHAVKEAEQWITEGMKNPYTNYTREILTDYAKKTEANLKSIKNIGIKDKPAVALK